jgi:small subunit ribosomal protein S6
MRAYELMIIFDADLEEADVQAQLTKVGEQVTAAGGRVASTDNWGKRRFAYEINHKQEGTYVVLELLRDAGGFDDLERSLRLADEVVRHKLLRLPDHEAARRGLLGEATPA